MESVVSDCVAAWGEDSGLSLPLLKSLKSALLSPVKFVITMCDFNHIMGQC
jgi:hypothetical protein